MPKISVCIPTYNRVHLLFYAIESVLQQTCQDFELIICDDSSNDGTPALISEFTDKRIAYIRHAKHIGKSNNMRSGFQAAKGKYFIKIDDDDRLKPEFLERTAAILDKDPSIDFVSTDHWIIDINNQVNLEQTKANSHYWGRADLSVGIVENLLEVAFVKQSLQIGATLFRHSTLQEFNFMRPNLQNCEDIDLLVRLSIAGKRCYYLPELLMEYRLHEGQRGLERDIPYLTDKLRYLTSFEFEDDLEIIRLQRLEETRLILGLRLIEAGEIIQGRQLVWSSKSFAPRKAWAGLALSLLPKDLRGRMFEALRQSAGR